MIALSTLAGAVAAALAAQEPEPLDVHTTFYPTTYFTERIGGEHVRVECPLPEEADPIFWKPSREVLRGYRSADLVVVNGARLEKWVGRASLPLATLVDTARPFEDEWLRHAEAITHRHGPEGEHTHAGVDGHTWVDPALAKRQAQVIRDALVRERPEHADAFRAGYDGLAEDLDALLAGFRALGPLPEGTALVASHPAYDYLAKRLGWPVVNLDLEPEAVPSEEEMRDAREELGDRRPLVLLWEGEPVPEAVERVRASLGVESVLFSPCETLPSARREKGEDYLSAMRANLERLEPFFRERG